MILTDAQISKFQSLCKIRFGKELTKQEALENGLRLVRLMEIVYAPMTKDEMKIIRKKMLSK